MRTCIVFSILFFIAMPTVAANKITLNVSQNEAYADSASYAQLKEFISAALNKDGIKLNVISLPVERGNTSCSKGEIDGQIARVPSVVEGNANLKATSFPIMYINARLMYLKSNTNFDEDHLQKYRGAGTLNNRAFSSKITSEHLNYTQVHTLSQTLAMLETRRTDYVALPDTIIQDILRENPKLQSQVKVSDKVFVRFQMHFIVNDKNYHLLPRIEKALRLALLKDRSKYPLIKDALNSNP